MEKDAMDISKRNQSFNSILITLFCLSIADSSYSSPKIVSSSNYQQHDFHLELVAESLGVPWGLSFISSENLFITQRDGSAVLLNVNTGRTQNITGLPDVLAIGQGGLMDVARNPYQPDSPWLYFTYTKDTGEDGSTTLARAKLNQTQLSDWQDLLITNSQSNTSRHYGSRITFDEKNHIYFTVGDRGVRDNAQDLRNHAGSVLRLHLDGSLPKDNPFIKHPYALKEIWSYGHRNPQGIDFDQTNKQLWLIEHGPRGGDELNLIKPGLNYGWPVISYGKEYWAPLAVGESTHKEGMEQPVTYYVPSIAPGSLLIYSGSAFPNWRNQLFIGALKLTHINVLKLNTEGQVMNETRLLESLGERIRSLQQSPEGWLYVGTDSGKIYRIRPR